MTVAAGTGAGIEAGEVEANGVRFGYLTAGDGPLVLCLHGFPDSAWTWAGLLPALAAAGYRGVAPFQRGYAPTDVPADGRYQTGALAADAVAMHEALGGDADAVVVGHDWGAPAAYGAAGLAPDRWRRVVGLAVPPGYGAALLDYEQLKRSFYMFFFQLPVATAVVAADDLAFLDHMWADWSEPGTDTAAALAHTKAALREPARLEAALGYYRALFDPSRHDPRLAAVQAAAAGVPPQPTLYLHGERDACIGVAATAGLGDLLPPGSEHEVVAGANHFLHLDQPNVVLPRILDWVAAGRT